VSIPATWADLPDLLHDAHLAKLAWRPAAADVSLAFHCLLRNTDGSPVPDPTVRVAVSGVTALAVAYDATARPSEFVPPRLLTTTDLRDWPCGEEPFVWVNDAGCEARFLDALRVDWSAGTAADLSACAHRVGLEFGTPVPHLSLLVGGAKLEAFFGNDPLPLDLWADRYGAWWGGWRRRWDATDETPDAPPAAEDTFIPAGVDPPLPPDYRWPDEPVVAWEPTDAPADVLAALARWFEDEAAKPPGAPGFDQRFYARQVDWWWVEGRRAGAAVRGVEHSPGEGRKRRGRNTESVQEFLLRRAPGGWAVQPLSRGWPPYGSAPARPAAEKPWLGRWKSGTVLSERKS
jgi:hypothetical protein